MGEPETLGRGVSAVRIEIATERLVLRALRVDDAERITALASEYDIARMTERIPHPYSIGDAEQWISTIVSPQSEELVCVIECGGETIGCIGLIRVPEGVFDNGVAILGYWIGKPYWGHGHATEAAQGVMRHAFHDWKVERICVDHFADNPASARVIEKLGFRYIKPVEVNSIARGGKVDALHYVMEAGEAEQQLWYRKNDERSLSK